jgi:hypothetical protein
LLADSSCIFWKLCKRRRRLANEFLDKLILSCFSRLGLGLFAGCGCVTLLFGCVAVGIGWQRLEEGKSSSSLALNEHDKALLFLVEKNFGKTPLHRSKEHDFLICLEKRR